MRNTLTQEVLVSLAWGFITWHIGNDLLLAAQVASAIWMTLGLIAEWRYA